MSIAPAVFAGAPVPEMPKVSDDSWIVNGEELQGKRWWTKNPKKKTTLLNPWLYHFDLTYSYSGTSGNVDADKHKGSSLLALRKQLFTSKTQFSMSRSDQTIALSGRAVHVESQRLQHGFQYAVTDWLEVVAGISWIQKDSTKFIDDRFTYFGGGLVELINRPNLFLAIGGFYGYSETAYWNDKVTDIAKYADFESVDDYTSGELYFKQKLEWNITDTITFTENGDYSYILENSDHHHWMVKFALEFEITKHFSFVSSYTINEEVNDFTEHVQDYFDERRASGLPAGEMENIDTTVSVGIKINF